MIVIRQLHLSLPHYQQIAALVLLQKYDMIGNIRQVITEFRDRKYTRIYESHRVSKNTDSMETKIPLTKINFPHFEQVISSHSAVFTL